MKLKCLIKDGAGNFVYAKNLVSFNSNGGSAAPSNFYVYLNKLYGELSHKQVSRTGHDFKVGMIVLCQVAHEL